MKASGTVVLLSLVMSVAFACLLLVLSQPGGSAELQWCLSLFFESGVQLLLLAEGETLMLTFYWTHWSNSLSLPFLAQQKGKRAPSLLLSDTCDCQHRALLYF